MKSLLSRLWPVAAALAVSPLASAAELGDAAKPLQIATWVKGKPVDLAAVKGKQIVVVEFWATWCPPCRASIPHLTELQKKFKDVIFVGVSDEDAATVKKFVAKMGDKMDYTVAVDDDGKTGEAYMKAFGIDGIPHAFVVDQSGRIVWQGHPMGGLEKSLDELVAGKFDLEKSKKRAAAQKKVEDFVDAASRDPNDPKLKAMGQELEALDAELGGIEPGEKFSADDVLKRVKIQGLMRDYQIAVMSGKSGTNLANIEQKLAENAPKDLDLAEFKDQVAFNKLVNDYMRAASGKGNAEELAALTKQLAAARPRDSRLLLRVAWGILEEKNLKTRDYDLAAKLAKASVDATESKELGPLYVYARTLFEGGKAAEAVDWQKKALALAGDNDEARKDMAAALQKYQAKAGAK
jgi:thiol-disulfide isomerase/thioredoxin